MRSRINTLPPSMRELQQPQRIAPKPHLRHVEQEPLVSPTLGEAFRRHWFGILFFALLGLGIGVAFGMIRTPVYKAEARLAVGRIDLSQPGALAGFTDATQTLASAYSRAIDSQDVVNPVARKLQTSPQDVRSHISATPVPETAVFAIRGTGPDSRRAIRLANLSAAALTRYVTDVNRSNPESSRVFKQLQSVVASRTEKQQALNEEREQDPLLQDRRRIGELESAIAVDDIRIDGLREAYSNSVQGLASAAQLQTQSRATDATSDRIPRLQIFGFAGLVSGLFIGVGIAILRANARVRREIRAGDAGI